MFFRLGFQTRSKVETLLEKEDVALEEVLDEDDVLQEAKAHNSKLVELYVFLIMPVLNLYSLIRKDNVKKLIEFVSIDGKSIITQETPSDNEDAEELQLRQMKRIIKYDFCDHQFYLLAGGQQLQLTFCAVISKQSLMPLCKKKNFWKSSSAW